jgi:ligand-binding SRPBCC domain-containing protein
MKIYELRTEITIKAPLEQVWFFFSEPKNLQRITPPYMGFQIVKCPDVETIFNGMIIEYMVRPILNLPFKWVTEIKEVQPLVSFTDIQLKGPYALWHHSHSFEKMNGYTKMRDTVKYAMPLGILGSIAHRLFVKKQLEEIFKYREATVGILFNKGNLDELPK